MERGGGRRSENKSGCGGKVEAFYNAQRVAQMSRRHKVESETKGRGGCIPF